MFAFKIIRIKKLKRFKSRHKEKYLVNESFHECERDVGICCLYYDVKWLLTRRKRSKKNNKSLIYYWEISEKNFSITFHQSQCNPYRKKTVYKLSSSFKLKRRRSNFYLTFFVQNVYFHKCHGNSFLPRWSTSTATKRWPLGTCWNRVAWYKMCCTILTGRLYAYNIL